MAGRRTVRLERLEGRSGELVLRRSGADLEVILNGAFLISTANEDSSRAMIARPCRTSQGDGLDVLIGGLGLGYALDEALAVVAGPGGDGGRVRARHRALVPRVRRRARGARRRSRARRPRPRSSSPTSPSCSPRVRGPSTSSSLDTDNGPEWLVRDDNAGLYDEAGVTLARDALRPGGAAVFWSPDRYPSFEDELRSVFADLLPVAAHDVVDGRRHEYTMYVALRGVD